MTKSLADAKNEFVNGLKDANDYINTTKIDVPTEITVDDTGKVTASTQAVSLKEIICGLLAGNGIKLPNIQICLKVNLARLLDEPDLPNDIRNALNEAEAALDEFIAHTNIDNVLGRLNSAIAEFAAVANMINFCGTPVIPRPIPNVLRDITGSFLGEGKALLDSLGTMLEGDIGGCIGLDGKFNPNLFTSGILKDIGGHINNLANMPDAVRQNIKNQLNAFSNDMRNLIEFENNFSGTYGNGGSTFGTANQRINTQVGLAVDMDNMTLSNAQALAGNLQAAYNSLNGYEVDDEGNNIFHYLLEPEMIARLQNSGDPTVPLADREPIYDHCNRIIGYTERNIQTVQQVSSGGPVEAVTQPGMAGLKESGTIVSPSPSTTTNLADTAVVDNSVPETPIGRPGDKEGDIASDGSHIYIASADYDGTNNIWTRALLSSW